MPSKTNKRGKKKNKCVYIIQKGKRKGKKCNILCKNKYCNDHCERKLTYLREYNKNKTINSQEDKTNHYIKNTINETKNLDNLPDINKILFKNMNIREEMIFIIKKTAGIKLYLDEDTEENIVNNVYNIIYGKCKCDTMVENNEIDEIEKYGINGCNRCSHKNFFGRVHYFKYTKTASEKKLKEKLENLKTKYDYLRSKHLSNIKIIKAIEAMKQKL
jgi:hypothetical protein